MCDFCRSVEFLTGVFCRVCSFGYIAIQTFVLAEKFAEMIL